MNPTIITVVFLLGVSPVFAQDAPTHCVGITDNIARLSCYDSAMQVTGDLSVPQIPRNTEAPASAPEETVPTDIDGTDQASAQSLDDFGLEMKNSDRSAAENARTLTVAEAQRNKFTGWTIVFTNGQTWKQVGTDSYRIEPGQQYIITRATLNSFMLGAEGKRSKIRITRVE